MLAIKCYYYTLYCKKRLNTVQISSFYLVFILLTLFVVAGVKKTNLCLSYMLYGLKLFKSITLFDCHNYW